LKAGDRTVLSKEELKYLRYPLDAIKAESPNVDAKVIQI